MEFGLPIVCQPLRKSCDGDKFEIHGQCIDSPTRVNTLYPKWIYPLWIETMAKKAPEEAPDPRTLLPLTPAVFHIMLALAGGECHGYAIMQEVERLTGGLLNLGPGTLYRSIQRMLVDGLIEETKDSARIRPGRRTPPLLPDHEVRPRGRACGSGAARVARECRPPAEAVA